MKQCPRHYRKGRADKIYSTTLRSRRAALGLCRSCEQPAVENSIFCELHRAKSRESVLRFRSTEKGVETNRLGRVSSNIERKIKKACTACGTTTVLVNLKCQRCVDSDARNNVKRRTERKASGQCIYCGGSAVVGRTGRQHIACEDCRIRRKGFDRSYSSRFSRARSGVRAKKFGWTIQFNEYVEIVKRPCTYCELDNTTDQGCGLDRQDPKQGYHLDNVVSCCPECNMVRNIIFTPEEMKVLGAAVRQVKLARMSKNSGSQ
jgi:hypothetical protein